MGHTTGRKQLTFQAWGGVIVCSQRGMHISESFWEQSLTASSFRAEMLGLCALHLLVRAISKYYKLDHWTSTLCCNNKQALLLSSHHRGRIRPSAKCADIRQSFLATKQTYNGGFTYIHVYGHMDQHLSWLQLNLPQQLNCACNTLAKNAVTNAITNRRTH